MKNADKPAYPIDKENNDAIDKDLDEIIRKSDRKKVAMAAMQGLLSNPDSLKRVIDEEKRIPVKAEEIIAAWSIEQADALLKALEESQ